MFDVIIVDNSINEVQELTKNLDCEQEITLWICGGVTQALEEISQVVPDIVFININLPEMSGLDLVHLIRKRNKDISIVLISEETIAAQVVYELGVNYYIKKPIQKEWIQTIFEDRKLFRQYMKYKTKLNEIDIRKRSLSYRERSLKRISAL